MPVNPDDPNIPQGCEDVAIFDAASDLCTPILGFGPIRESYFTRSAFAASPTATEIARRLGLATTAPNDPDAMTGPFVAAVSFGGAARATEEFNGKLYAKPSRREFKVSTKEVSDKNVALADLTAKGGLATRMFGIDTANNWYGGQTGLGSGTGNLVLDLTVPEGLDTAQTIDGTFTTGLGYFRGKRVPSPIPLLSA